MKEDRYELTFNFASPGTLTFHNLSESDVDKFKDEVMKGEVFHAMITDRFNKPHRYLINPAMITYVQAIVERPF